MGFLGRLPGAYGAMFTGWGVASFVGPYFAVSLYDLTGTYVPAFLVFALLCIPAIIIAQVMGEARKLTGSRARAALRRQAATRPGPGGTDSEAPTRGPGRGFHW